MRPPLDAQGPIPPAALLLLVPVGVLGFPGGGIDVTYEARMTPGWGLRGEAITIISMQYQ